MNLLIIGETTKKSMTRNLDENVGEILPGHDISQPLVTKPENTWTIRATVPLLCPASGLHTEAREQRQGFVTVQQKLQRGGCGW